MSKLAPLGYFEKARRAVAQARTMNEVMKIKGEAAALAAAAKVAKDRSMEADAVAMRPRCDSATRSTATGAEGDGRACQGRQAVSAQAYRGRRRPGSDAGHARHRQTPRQAGAHARRALGDAFEAVVADARDKVSRAVRNAVREVEIEQERAGYRERTVQGGTVADLEALAASGYRAGVICPDFPWAFETYSGKGKQRSADRRYDTWPMERVLAMAPLIRKLAADDCALLLWTVCPEQPGALELIKACGFEYKTVGFFWLKTAPHAEVVELNGKGLHWGMGYATRANVEPVLLAVRGEPLRLAADVHQVVIAPVTEHSEKPDKVYRRIERLYPGPYLELFARKERDRWWKWGNEVAAEAMVSA